MKYFKQSGSVWDTYYCLDKENASVSIVEARYTDTAKCLVDTYLVATNTAARGSYDVQAAEEISGYTAITAKEWHALKKEVADSIKMLGAAQ